MGIEWIVVWMLVLASLQVVKTAVVDAYVQIVHPDREAPSLAARRARIEIAQKQFELTGSTTVGQTVADRVAARIANPRPRPRWIDEAQQYLSALLAEQFAKRRHAYADRQDRKHGAAPAGKRCWRCDVGAAAESADYNGLCLSCHTINTAACARCGHNVTTFDLQDGTCSSCRSGSARASDVPDATYHRAEPVDADGPAVLVLHTKSH